MHSLNLTRTDTHDLAKLEQLRKWKTAPDLDTLFALNKAYIKGELDIHPAHGRPLYDETTDVIKPLLAMNEYGMFTFQGQPRSGGAGIVEFPEEHEERAEIVPTLTEAWCRCCANHFEAGLKGWGELRLLPFVQFFLPVDQRTTATVVQATRFASILLAEPSLHTMISWPKGLELPDENMSWSQADLTEAEKYIPQADLDMYWHVKSQHCSSCAHEIRTAATKDKVKKAKWKPANKHWSEVNDYHLRCPRLPKLFLGSESKTIVFGVNATSFVGGVKDIEGFLTATARRCGFPRCFVD